MKTLYALLIITLSSPLFSQIQGKGGLPTSTKLVLNDKVIEQWIYTQPDITALQAEDASTDDQGTAPWRFGYNNYTNLNTTNAGSWFDLPNGARLWLLRVKCEQALTVNLTFENTNIPEGNQLFVYNPSKDFILGAFTQEHIYDGQLGTELIPGQEAVVEYYVAPQNMAGHIQVGTVTHGYRTANEFIQKAFGSSGSCNMNANCPDGLPWTQQRNSAVMLVSGSSGFCSGALINNTQNDGKPYVLTANHCYSNPATWVFRFNWQATDCANPATSPTFQSLSGAVLRARRTPSDFCLVEITGGLVNGTVPLDYNPYFSGWDNSGTIPTTTVCIHHPSGDIKKISFDDAAPSISQAMGSSEANSTWTVEWDRNTTTEGGSSGSPLFDQNHRIIGQLWGGGASCQNLSAPD
ncbi:MAG: trypsin-like serine peptidase [Flavobacteriia bacterium]